MIKLRPGDGSLDVRVIVADGQDAEHFAHVVAEHLERFGWRDELHVEWESAGE